MKRMDQLSPEECTELTLAMYNNLDPCTQWEEIKAQTEDAIKDIIQYAAERAAVLFNHFKFTWKPGNKEFVPTIEDIFKHLSDNVRNIREFESTGGGSGRLYVIAKFEDFEEPKHVTDIDLYFHLGNIPIQYLHTNAWMTAIRMKRENQRR